LMISILSLLLSSLLLVHVTGWSKVFMMVFDNHGTSEFLASPAWFRIQARTYVFSTYYAVSQDDAANYVALIYGDTTFDPTAKTLTDLADAHGKTWRGYFEDYQPINGAMCNNAETIANYTRSRNPFMDFTENQNANECGRIVGVDRFQLDIAAEGIAEFSFYVPSIQNSGANATIDEVGNYFTNFLRVWWDPYPTAWRDTLFIGVFASSGNANDLRVPMFVINPCVPAALTVGEDKNYTHYSLLQYVEKVIFNDTSATLNRQDVSATPIGLAVRDCPRLGTPPPTQSGTSTPSTPSVTTSPTSSPQPATLHR